MIIRRRPGNGSRKRPSLAPNALEGKGERKGDLGEEILENHPS
jgi:hypothetical protein